MTIDESSALAAARQIAKQRFGFDALRPHQEATIAALAAGRDCLTTTPTGGGKTLCYMLPALAREGVTLVISPLVALIRDQVLRYSKLGVPCGALDGLQTPDEKQETWDLLKAGHLKLLYIAPERLAQPGFKERLNELAKVTLVAIDEAHCISQWGFHFRPDYRKIGANLEGFPAHQKVALSATVTSRVRQDICQALQLQEPKFINVGLERDNLKQKVIHCKKLADQLTLVLQAVLNEQGQGIVYAPTRKKVNEVYDTLKNAGLRCARYHAGLAPGARAQGQSQFCRGDVQVMVATNAFGLGIDKGDIRFVFHCGMPASLEQYVQEVGRAGRDGKPARCYLFYGGRDFYLQKFMIDKSFPESHVLIGAYREATRMIDDYPGFTDRELLESLQHKFQLDPKETLGIVQLLLREGVIEREPAPQDSGSFALRAGATSADIFAEYPKRKIEHLNKLGKMHAYVKAGSGREAILKSYFALEDA